MQPGTIPGDSIRSVVAAVFRQRQYDRGFRETLFWRIVDWIDWLFRSAFQAVGQVRALQWALITVALLVIVLIVTRVAFVARVRRQGLRVRSRTKRTDPWALAQEAGAGCRFVEGAHYLYLALIEAVAHRTGVSLHPAKTVGDYTRDLRRLSSPDLPTFREFATIYEPIVWGSGKCGEADFERMRSLTESVRNAA